MTNITTNPSFSNGYCWTLLFEESRRDALIAFYPPYISTKQLYQILDDHHNYINILSYFKIIYQPRGLIHITLTNNNHHLNFNQTINQIIRFDQFLDDNSTFLFTIIGGTNIDQAREHLTSSMHQEVHQTVLLSRLDTIEKKINTICPYRVNPKLALLLQERGIGTSSYAPETHDHPAHKAIENFLLHAIIAKYSFAALTVAFTKSQKFLALANSVNPRLLNNLHLTNSIISSVDLIRYPEVDYTTTITVDTPYLFLHDSLQYNTFLDIATLFKKNKNLVTIIATAIIPIESKDKNNSVFPDLYTLEYPSKTNDLIYKPEGHGGAAYIQPLSAIKWLTTNVVHGPDVSYSITKLTSKFAHHIILITTIPTIIPKYNIFDVPELVKLPNLYKTRLSFRNNYLPRDFAEAVIHYAKTLKNTDRKSLNAVIRTQFKMYNPDQLPHSTLEVFVDCVFLYVENGFSDTYRKLNLTRLKKIFPIIHYHYYQIIL